MPKLKIRKKNPFFHALGEKKRDAKFHWWLVLHFDLNALREIPILVIAAQCPIQPKGQLISKGLFGILNSPKKRMKKKSTLLL